MTVHIPKLKDIILFVIVFAAVGAFFIFEKSPRSQDKYSVIENSSIPKIQVATSFPLAVGWIEAVGRGRVQVKVMAVGDAETVREWSKGVDSQESMIFFSIGNGFDGWVDDATKNIAHLETVPLSRFATSTTRSFKDVFDSSRTITNGRGEYYWLSFDNVHEIIQGIARILGDIDSVNKEYYLNNAYDYVVQVDSLSRDSYTALRPFLKRRVALAGTRWEPLADSLQLNVTNAFDDSRLSDFSRDQIISGLKRAGVRAVIGDDALANTLKPETTSTVPFGLAPITWWGDDTTDYVSMMRDNVSRIIRALE